MQLLKFRWPPKSQKGTPNLANLSNLESTLYLCRNQMQYVSLFQVSLSACLSSVLLMAGDYLLRRVIRATY